MNAMCKMGVIATLRPRHVWRALMLICLVVLSGRAFADGSGSVIEGAVKIRFRHAYAYRHPSAEDSAAQVTTILFSSKAIHALDTDKIDQAVNRQTEIEKQLHGASWAEVNLLPGDEVTAKSSVSESSFMSGRDWYKLDLKRNDDQFIEGTLHSADPGSKGKYRGGYFDLHFALSLVHTPVVAVPKGGNALPADGGEPFAVYRGQNAAMIKGDFETASKAMLKKVAPAVAGMASKDKPMAFNVYAGILINDPEFDSGYIKGGVATLLVHGKNGDGKACRSTVTMRKEDGAWRFDDEKMSDNCR